MHVVDATLRAHMYFYMKVTIANFDLVLFNAEICSAHR